MHFSLTILTCIQGKKFDISKGTVIFVESESPYYDGNNNLKFKESDTVNDYFKYCDDYYNSSGSGYSSDSAFSGSGFVDFYSKCICCAETLCLCDSIQSASHHAQSNTIIALANSVNLVSVKPSLFNLPSAVTVFQHITNLSIIGYNNATIDCNFFRSIHFYHCNNVIIQNIRCGNNTDDKYTVFIADKLYDDYFYYYNFNDDFFNIYHHGIMIYSCTNVYLKICTFVASMVEIFAVSSFVHIDQSYFLAVTYLIEDNYYTATTLIINQIASIVTVEITNSLFLTIDNKGLLLFYILVDDPNGLINVFIDHTSFSHLSFDPGWVAENGLIWMRLSCNDYITFNEVKITSNSFAPPSDVRLAAVHPVLSVTTDLSVVQGYQISIRT